MKSDKQLTEIIELVSSGEQEPGEALLPMVYEELLLMARGHMAQERSGHTLQATALVHEAYARLFSGIEPKWENRRHFFSAAAEAMRRILIDHARARKRQKRGGEERKRLNLDFANVAELSHTAELEEVLALNDAIQRLEQLRPRAAEVMKLRFFAGMDIHEVAELMSISPRTVNMDWAYARAWLFEQLRQ